MRRYPMNAGRDPGVLVAALAAVLGGWGGGSVHGDFTGWHFERSDVTVGGTEFAVIDVYAQFDDHTDTVLAVFNSVISTSTGVDFRHSDLNTLGGSPGAWNAVLSGNIPGLIDARVDSFVLIGGVIGGANSTALDPAFNPGTGGTVAENAGWFNSNPPNLQGRVDPVTLRTWVARFTIPRSAPATDLQFAANSNYNQGPGTSAQFAYDNGQGSGPMSVVPFNYLPACDSDLDGNGIVNGADLAELLAVWGPCDGKTCADADFNDDGIVNGADLSAVLGSWGACP